MSESWQTSEGFNKAPKDLTLYKNAIRRPFSSF